MVWLASILSLLLGAFACFVVMSVRRADEEDEGEDDEPEEVEATDVLDVPRCHSLQEERFAPWNPFAGSGVESCETLRCDLEVGHDGPHGCKRAQREHWWPNEIVADPLTVYVCFDGTGGELVSATVRPTQAKALAKQGHDVRVVPVERLKAKRLEVES